MVRSLTLPLERVTPIRLTEEKKRIHGYMVPDTF